MDTEIYYDIKFPDLLSNETSLPLFDHPKGTLLDSTAEFGFRIAVYIILSAAFSIFGTGANIINICVFIRQGLFSGGSTLNLFFLTVADLGVVFTNLLHSIGFSVIVADIQDLPFDPFAILYLAIGWPHTIFVLINRILTAYIAFERCMCVVLPFRVQSLFTPRKSLVYIVIIYAYTFLSHVPIYLIHRLEFEEQEENTNGGVLKNVSKLVLAFGPNRDIFHDVVYYGNYFVVSFASVITVLICTVVTSVNINTSKEWRKTVANATSTTQISTIATENDSVSICDSTVPQTNNIPSDNNIVKNNQARKRAKAAVDKETRLVKMIVSISIIFLVCYTPELMLIVMKFVDDRVRTNGQYHRLAHLMYSIVFVMATVNSSINIFVYYAMSSKYRGIFIDFFGRKKDLGLIK